MGNELSVLEHRLVHLHVSFVARRLSAATVASARPRVEGETAARPAFAKEIAGTSKPAMPVGRTLEEVAGF